MLEQDNNSVTGMTIIISAVTNQFTFQQVINRIQLWFYIIVLYYFVLIQLCAFDISLLISDSIFKYYY